jgi:hypothetical protein
VGRSFDVSEFLARSPFSEAVVFRRGDPQAGAPVGTTHTASGFNVGLSAAGTESLAEQIRDASRFIQEHEAELRRLGSFPGVEEVCIDFEIPRRDGAAQHDVFPADLLWRAGALDMDLVVTHTSFVPGPTERPN